MHLGRPHASGRAVARTGGARRGRRGARARGGHLQVRGCGRGLGGGGKRLVGHVVTSGCYKNHRLLGVTAFPLALGGAWPATKQLSKGGESGHQSRNINMYFIRTHRDAQWRDGGVPKDWLVIFKRVLEQNARFLFVPFLCYCCVDIRVVRCFTRVSLCNGYIWQVSASVLPYSDLARLPAACRDSRGAAGHRHAPPPPSARHRAAAGGRVQCYRLDRHRNQPHMGHDVLDGKRLGVHDQHAHCLL